MGLLDDAIREHLELKRQHGASEEELVRAEQEALAPARREPAAGSPPAEIPQTGDAAPEEGEPAPLGPVDEPTAAHPPPPLVDEPTAAHPPPPVDEPVYADEYAAEPAPADLDEPSYDDATRVREVVSFDDHEEDHLVPDLGDAPAEPGDELVEAEDPGTPKPHGDPALDEPDLVPVEDDDVEPDEVPVEEQLSPGQDPYRSRTSILDDPLDESAPPPPAQPPPTGEDDDGDVLEETPDFLQETPEHDKLWFEQKPPRDFDFD
jgi:hypothetical protein